MKSESFDLSTLYTDRRQKLMAQMEDGVALISSSGMAPDPTLFDKNLVYLTGQTSRDTYLLLAPQGVRAQTWETVRGPEVGRGRIGREILFVRELTEREKLIDGEGTSYAAVRRASGVDLVLPLSRLNGVLHDNLANQTKLWVNVATVPRLDKPVTPDLVFINQIRERFFWLEVRNIAPLIHDMRWVKDVYEVGCLRNAFEVHTAIYEKMMRALKPGVNEKLGEAIWHYEAKANYDPALVGCETFDTAPRHIIVASGASTTIGHYIENDQVIQDGDLVLLDAGIEFQGYSSDITRTFPANGVFTPRQRELYAIVLEAQKRAIATMKPGSNQRDAHEAVYQVWKENGLEAYGYGTCGHPVGLNIHDANGMTKYDQDKAFEPGVVVVIEPFIAVAEEGIGIRIEDGVLITEAGCEALAGPPKEIDEVEALCRRD